MFREPHVLDVDARYTVVGRRSKYKVQDALIDMCWYVDLLEQVVVIQDLCDLMIHLAKHRSRQLKSLQMKNLPSMDNWI